jgi:pimeloyl-ACP methyl ester carboxylesterase
MLEFLLIHGGSHGAWCWEGVIRELAHLGCKGHALDLPGGGDDPTHRASVTFDSYVSAVNEFIETTDLQNFVLVGHSLAGIILPEIVAANMGRIREVVFIASIVLDLGERAIDLIDPSRIPDYYRLAEASSDHSLMLDYHAARQRFFSDLGNASARAAYAKLTPQPFAPFLEPARHGARSISSISRYIICRNDQNLTFDLCRRFAEKLGGVIEEINAGHNVMLSKPGELSALLTKGRSAGPPFRLKGVSPLFLNRH